MKPSEIRNINVNWGKFGELQDKGEAQNTANFILREIAAQLSEINEKLPRPYLASTDPK